MEKTKAKHGVHLGNTKAPWITDKPMPPYGMGSSELVYPGEGDPFSTKGPENSSVGGPHHPGTPAHPAVPPTEVPRNRVHPGAVLTGALLEALTACATACERCIAANRGMNEPHRFADCTAACKACADTCILLHSMAVGMDRELMIANALDLSPVCSRICEACAVECSKHPGMESCVECEAACRKCAIACRNFAR